MAGTKAGAEKRRQTMIAKAGGIDAYLEQQRANAAKGGSNPNPDNPGNFKNNPKLARKAGRKGGKLSKRGKGTILGVEPDLTKPIDKS